jgi:hypothetical protein
MESLPEFFRPEHLRPVDSDGFELPSWLNPYFAIPDQVEPDPADVVWLNEHSLSGGSPEPFEPSDQDWDDYARWSGSITDDDIAAAGLPVG